ncbi:hypothetical protein QP248_02665 [Aerococcus sp. UMB8608]|uniref:Uncharacterized protein n=1 Tax=Aerococcus sanguinicola TaxID=119206 RepID=A0A0X8FCN4_9LACT|nr:MULTISPECIES: hypothetical protein [Aerococcus]AMB94904.1 hypothetical protein AWM72_09115 [Aerococcus sanguinicola]MDK6679352.1 hypothetical protein [Aerococcus sp. UMB8608]MDK6685806.1 hypothetical protein [Aerococcus sp. UMB8623]OFT95889.1 hypothetical protein HMPREF3090_03450 [Aerococcus sp. HMSC23C02]
MDKEAVLGIVKSRLGITSQVRDTYLLPIISGVISEIENQQGITLKSDRPDHVMFVADYAEYRYSNKDDPTLPRHLQWRLHNLVVGEKHVE